MEPSFASLVSLIRQSSRVVVDGFSLQLYCRNTPANRLHLERISEWKEPQCTVEGARLRGDLTEVPDGTFVEVRFRDISGNNKLVVSDITYLLQFQNGFFLCAPPQEYYLVAEKYAPGDSVVPERVGDYLRVPRLLKFLKSVADAEIDRGGRLYLVFLSGKKLDIPVIYSASDLCTVPSLAMIEELEESVLSKPHQQTKSELFKRALTRRLQDVAESKRFSRVLAGFDELRKSFNADLDHFLSEFDFERLREQFEQKRLEYVLKINAAIGDLVSKLLAIPIAQGIVAAQFKADATHAMSNLALMVGSLIFTMIGVVLVLGHSNSLREIKREVVREELDARSRYPDLHKRIHNCYSSVLWRARWFAPSIVVLALVLLAVGFFFSLAAFDQFEPWRGLLGETVDSAISSAAGISEWFAR